MSSKRGGMFLEHYVADIGDFYCVKIIQAPESFSMGMEIV